MTGDGGIHDTESRKQNEAAAEEEEAEAAEAAEDQATSHTSSGGSSPVRFTRPIKRARAHHISEHYSGWVKKMAVALEIAVVNLAEGLSSRWPVNGITFLPDGRISVHLRQMDYANVRNDCSQSKLSQQELMELQKATRFDKKELQQWYRGKYSFSICKVHQLVQEPADFEFDRFSEGLSLGHALKRRVPTHLQAVLPLR